MAKKITFHQVLTFAFAVLLGISAFTLSYSETLKVPDQFISNYIYAYNPLEHADERITIIAIDSASEDEYGEYDTWSRSLLADSVTILTQNKAAVIGLDTDLSATKDTDGDSELVEACKAHGSVISMARANFNSPDAEKRNSSDMALAMPAAPDTDWNNHPINNISYAYDDLKEVTTAGITDAIARETDLSIRTAALSIKTMSNKTEPSFAAAAYMLYKDYCKEEYSFPELDNQNLFGFRNIYDPSGYNIISFSDLLSGNYNEAYIQDHIVLIGEYTQVTHDFKGFDLNYFKSDSAQQEILIESAIIQTLLTNKAIQDVPLFLQSIILGLFICILYIICSRRSTLVAIFAYLLTIFIFVLFSYFMYLQGFRILLLVPSIFAVTSFVINLIYKLITATISQHKMKRTLNLYVDSQVVDTITEASPFQLAALNSRRNIAVLFVDIRGFTTISESLEPEQVVEILNHYFTIIFSSITAWHGTLDKFIGDAAMAIFNAPSDLEDYEFNAVCAADDIMKEFKNIKFVFSEKYNRDINIGIGINSGDAIVGNIGCYGRMDYTAIGDTVNIASRLESKAAPGQILVSEQLYEKIKTRCDASLLGALELKGKTKTVNTYVINSIEKPSAPNASGRKEFLRESTLLHTKIRPDK